MSNPRLHKGLPTLSEIKAADYWIMGPQLGGVFLTILDSGTIVENYDSLRAEETRQPVPILYWYWPCDRHGNKVPWPIKKGKP